MQIKYNYIINLVAIGVVTFSCAQQANKDSDNASENSSISIVGTMALSSNLNLRLSDNSPEIGTDKDVFCRTYDEPAKTCVVTVDETGKFDGACSELSGKQFTCYLRENGIIVSEFKFDDKVNVSANKSGKITVDANVDADTGKVTTAVDSSSSDALNTSPTDSVSELFTTPLEGRWQVSCATSGDEVSNFYGKDRCPDSSNVYFSVTPEEDEKMIAPWQSKEIYQSCTDPVGSTTYSVAKPNLHIDLAGDGTNLVAFDLTSATTLGTSLLSIYAALPASLKTSIDNTESAISSRAITLKQTVDAIRKVSSKDFGGQKKYPLPDATILKQRLVLNLLYLKSEDTTDLDYCMALLNDDTLPSMYRRTHSVKSELLCQMYSDKTITDLNTFLATIQASSCIPKVFFDIVYSSTTQNESIGLLCPGPKNSEGECTDTEGNYTGEILGRFSMLTYKDRVDNVFDMTQNNSIVKTVIHPTKGLLSCSIIDIVTVKGKKTANDSFDAVFSEQFVDRCQGNGASSEVRDFSGNLTGTSITRYATAWKASFKRIGD